MVIEGTSEAVLNLVKAVEVKRKKASRYVLGFGLGGAATFILGIVFCGFAMYGNRFDQAFLVIGSIFFIAGLILIVVGVTYSNHFKRETVEAFSGLIEEKLFPGILKNPRGGFSEKEVLSTGFFAAPDRYYAKDLATGVYKDIAFTKAKYQLQRRETRSDGKNTYTDYVDYAVGTLFRFDFERDFDAVVRVLEKTSFINFAPRGMKKVETEFIAFNKKFLTYTDDEQLVFYLLTPQIQEKIMSLETMVKGSFYLAFTDNHLYIAVDDNWTSIKVSVTKQFSVEDAERLIALLAIPAIFIDELGLSKTKYKKDAGTTV